jgi:hypothetical protein
VTRAPRIGRTRLAIRNATLFVASAFSAFALVASPGCGTSAVGVGDCREIEEARCEAGPACGIITDVDECKRYYRDHCLHGLATTAPPQRADVDLCVAQIRQAGECAKTEGGKSAELVADCGLPQANDATLACEVVQYPERAYACSFLTGKPVAAPTAGQGGQGGDGG